MSFRLDCRSIIAIPVVVIGVVLISVFDIAEAQIDWRLPYTPGEYSSAVHFSSGPHAWKNTYGLVTVDVSRASGIDFSAGEGADCGPPDNYSGSTPGNCSFKVRAMESGRLIYAGKGELGNQVAIKLETGEVIVYGHLHDMADSLKSAFARQFQLPVDRGDLIGRAGQTGIEYSEDQDEYMIVPDKWPTHLHVELRDGGACSGSLCMNHYSGAPLSSVGNPLSWDNRVINGFVIHAYYTSRGSDTIYNYDGVAINLYGGGAFENLVYTSNFAYWDQPVSEKDKNKEYRESGTVYVRIPQMYADNPRCSVNCESINETVEVAFAGGGVLGSGGYLELVPQPGSNEPNDGSGDSDSVLSDSIMPEDLVGVWNRNEVPAFQCDNEPTHPYAHTFFENRTYETKVMDVVMRGTYIIDPPNHLALDRDTVTYADGQTVALSGLSRSTIELPTNNLLIFTNLETGATSCYKRRSTPSANAPAVNIVEPPMEPVAHCPNAPVSYLRQNIHGRVTFTDGTPTRLRASPSINAPIVKNMVEGTEFDVIGGPECADGYTWWQLRLGDQTEGWSAEGDSAFYFLEPYGQRLLTATSTDLAHDVIGIWEQSPPEFAESGYEYAFFADGTFLFHPPMEGSGYGTYQVEAGGELMLDYFSCYVECSAHSRDRVPIAISRDTLQLTLGGRPILFHRVDRQTGIPLDGESPLLSGIMVLTPVFPTPQIAGSEASLMRSIRQEEVIGMSAGGHWLQIAGGWVCRSWVRVSSGIGEVSVTDQSIEPCGQRIVQPIENTGESGPRPANQEVPENDVCPGASNCSVSCANGAYFEDACPADGMFASCEAWQEEACMDRGGVAKPLSEVFPAADFHPYLLNIGDVGGDIDLEGVDVTLEGSVDLGDVDFEELEGIDLTVPNDVGGGDPINLIFVSDLDTTLFRLGLVEPGPVGGEFGGVGVNWTPLYFEDHGEFSLADEQRQVGSWQGLSGRLHIRFFERRGSGPMYTLGAVHYDYADQPGCERYVFGQHVYDGHVGADFDLARDVIAGAFGQTPGFSVTYAYLGNTAPTNQCDGSHPQSNDGLIAIVSMDEMNGP